MAAPTERTEGWNSAMDAFPKGVRAEVDQMWDVPGRLGADSVGRIVGALGTDVGTLSVLLLPVAVQYAVAPVSGFAVGAVAAGTPSPGTRVRALYLGANFEIAGAALGSTVHAEQAAVNNAWLSGERGVEALAVSAPPCGHCRQFLHELVTAARLSVLLRTDPHDPLKHSARSLKSLLPAAFGPADLGVNGGLMDLSHGVPGLALESGMPGDPVVAAALDAARCSYAPYLTGGSHGHAGVALQLADGSIWPGRLAENAAYNPSLPPLGSALSFMNMSQPLGGTRQVVRCALVEAPSLSSHLAATRATLAAYAPGVEVEFHSAKRVSP